MCFGVPKGEEGGLHASRRKTHGGKSTVGRPRATALLIRVAGGGREVTGALGDVGRVERGVPTTRRLIAQLLPLPLPLSMPMHVGTGDAVSLFFLVSLGSDAVGRPGCGVVRESVGGTLRMKVNKVMILVRSHTPQPSCGQELQCSLVVVVVADGWTLESRPRGLLFLKSSLHNIANAPLGPPPPRRECVSRPSIGWAFLMHG